MVAGLDAGQQARPARGGEMLGALRNFRTSEGQGPPALNDTPTTAE
jgi:hypothetical protein